jgi:hypothetical protein
LLRILTAQCSEAAGWGSSPSKGKVCLVSTVSRLALGPTQLPIQWVLGVLLPVPWFGYNGLVERSLDWPSLGGVQKTDGSIA